MFAKKKEKYVVSQSQVILYDNWNSAQNETMQCVRYSIFRDKQLHCGLKPILVARDIFTSTK